MPAAIASRRRPLMKPCRPSRAGTDSVPLSAIDMSGTKPWWWRSCGTNPAPAASASGTLPGRGRRPAISTWPPAADRSPTTVSATSVRPLPAAPARPTISPAPTWRLTSWYAPSALVSPRTLSAAGAAASTVRACPAGRPPAVSPVMAATRSARGSSATGAVTMCRASRNTVTMSQIS